ncbi:hypothetical protein BC833DRAFT_178221 [Globomyces pollinis-pini]|nr:hypothetical protein BC833DRAFT_178221 [Globomyces pollinis-pini]
MQSDLSFLKSKSYSGTKTDEAEAYLNTHRIPDIILSLTQSLLVERPANPKQHMDKNLQLMRSIRARNQNQVLFTRENLQALFRFFDHVGRGYISMSQYDEAMKTIGALKFNPKPSGYGKLIVTYLRFASHPVLIVGLDHITMEVFVEEA